MPNATVIQPSSVLGSLPPEAGWDGAPGNFNNLLSDDGFTSVLGITEHSFAVEVNINITPPTPVPTNAVMAGDMALNFASGKRSFNGYSGNTTVYKTAGFVQIMTASCPTTKDVMQASSTSTPISPILTPALCNSGLHCRFWVDLDAFSPDPGSLNTGDMLAWSYMHFVVEWQFPAGGFAHHVAGLVGAALGLGEMGKLAAEVFRRTGVRLDPADFRSLWRDVVEYRAPRFFYGR